MLPLEASAGPERMREDKALDPCGEPPGWAPAQFRASRGSPSVTTQRTSAIVGIDPGQVSPALDRRLAAHMDEAELARMRETPLWLDEDPPQGLLRALVAVRERE